MSFEVAPLESKSSAMADEIRKVAKPLELDFFSTGYRRAMILVMVGKINRQLMAASDSRTLFRRS